MVSLQRIKNLCTLSITLLFLFSLQLTSLSAMDDIKEEGKNNEEEPIDCTVIDPKKIWNKYYKLSKAEKKAESSVRQKNVKGCQHSKACQSHCPISDWDIGSYFFELSRSLDDIVDTANAFKLRDLSEEPKESDPETYSLLLDQNNILVGRRAERAQDALVLFYDFYCKHVKKTNNRAHLIRFFQDWIPNGPLLLIERKHDCFALAMRLNHIIDRVGLTKDARNTLKSTQCDDNVHLLSKYLLTAFEGENALKEKLAVWGRKNFYFQKFKKRRIFFVAVNL